MNKFKKSGNEDCWTKFKTLFCTNFVLIFIEWYYYNYGELDLGWNLLLIWFRLGLFLIINIIIGIIGGNFNDINRKYGTIHPEIKSKLIKNYKILAKALGDYFPKGDTKEFDCYYGSRYNSSYSNYNVNIEISNDIYINHELNNKKQTIKISRNQ